MECIRNRIRDKAKTKYTFFGTHSATDSVLAASALASNFALLHDSCHFLFQESVKIDTDQIRSWNEIHLLETNRVQ